VTFTRIFSAIAMSAAISLAGPGYSAAQSLSDSASALTSSRSSGYMGLGGNLGRAIGDRHTRQAKSAKPNRAEKHIAQRPRTTRRVEKAAYVPNNQSPIFLIAQSLDHTGLNIGALTTRTRGP
jgi:hypothetical protein